MDTISDITGSGAVQIMIYTMGDSFTKWHWPTWSDWLSVYLNQEIKNLAYPGYTNELIYLSLIKLRNQLSEQDIVYIMWTGNNRVCEWYDHEHVSACDIAGFFPDIQGKLWFGTTKPFTGFYKTHPDRMPSFTHMVIDNFDIMLKTQWLLNSVGCDYRMMFWQNPWADTREMHVPEFHTTWNTHPDQLTHHEQQVADVILSTPLVQDLLSAMDWSRFVISPEIQEASSYSGLWEFLLTHPELLSLNHDRDAHPNTLAHHDWVTEIMHPELTPIHRSNAAHQAKQYQYYPLPENDYRADGILNMYGELASKKH